MTSPVSPSETISKAMEGVTRYANSYNSNGLGFSNGITEDENGGYVRYDAYHALALQLEAMKREMAELQEALKPFSTVSSYFDHLSGGSVMATISLSDLRRARTLIQGEKK